MFPSRKLLYLYQPGHAGPTLGQGRKELRQSLRIYYRLIKSYALIEIIRQSESRLA